MLPQSTDQNNRFKELIEYLSKNSPYYQRVFDQEKIDLAT